MIRRIAVAGPVDESDGKHVRRIRQDAEVDEVRSQRADDGAYLALAREIRAEVTRVSADPAAGVELLTEAIERWPRQARERAAQAAFAGLGAEQQWQILAALFDDRELREALDAERVRRVALATRQARAHELSDGVRSRGALDLRKLVSGEELTVGLFREADVRAAIGRGSDSATCARRMVVQATAEPGVVRVISDEFNPEHGLFVTPDYDERVWQRERLAAHSLVGLGAAGPGDGGAQSFAPIVYCGGRLDVRVGDEVREGRLHAGYATLSGAELFTVATQVPTQSTTTTQTIRK